MNLTKLAPLAGLVVAGAAGGAGIAALTPGKDEGTQSKITGALAGIGIVGGLALMAASGRMQDGGIVTALLGVTAMVGGGVAGGATLGSMLVDANN